MNIKKIVLFLTLVGFWIVLSIGCSTKTQSSNAEYSAVPENDAIVIGYSNWVGWWPWAIAEKQGFFAKNNLNVELRWFDGYLESMEAFAAGQLDGNCQTLNDTIFFAGSAVNGEVAILVNDNSEGNDKIIVAEDINQIEDLKQKKVALEEGVVSDFLLTLVLESRGLKRSDVEIVSLETAASSVVFASGQVDAVGAFPPYWLTALGREGARELVSSAEFPGSFPDLLVVSQNMIDEQPDKAQALVNTWFDVMDYMAKNPQKSDRIMAARAKVNLDEFELFREGTRMFSIEDNLEAFSLGKNMRHLNYAAPKVAEFMQNAGFIPEAPDLTKIFDDRFIQAYALAKNIS